MELDWGRAGLDWSRHTTVNIDGYVLNAFQARTVVVRLVRDDGTVRILAFPPDFLRTNPTPEDDPDLAREVVERLAKQEVEIAWWEPPAQ